jgi:hypothetical protein
VLLAAPGGFEQGGDDLEKATNAADCVRDLANDETEDQYMRKRA